MKKVFVGVILLLVCSLLFARVPLKELVPDLSEEQLSDVLSGGMIQTASYNHDVWPIIPSASMVVPQLEKSLSVTKGFTIAICGLIPYPEDWKNLTQEEMLLEMLNKSLTISTMKGLTYISRRAGYKEKTLFDDSSVLGSNDRNDRIADPTYSSLPETLQYHLFQDDTSFGKNVYLSTYSMRGNELFVSMTNETALSVLGVKIVAPGKVSMALDMFQTEEGIYVVGVSSVVDKNPQINIVGIKVDVEESILNRVIALKNWFAAQITK